MGRALRGIRSNRGSGYADMRKRAVERLSLGLYRLYWKEKSGGGHSVASVGNDAAGNRWYAPSNWIVVPSFDWSMVKEARRVI